jgi:AcrR family transcriptional regulator
MTQTQSIRHRDKEATRAAIVAAAKDLLSEDGFQGLGVNSLARKASCDKQLIYRYFGGLEGVLAAIGEDLVRWVSASVAINEAEAPRTYRQVMRNLAFGYLEALRNNRLIQQITVWELSAASEGIAPLIAARNAGLQAWVIAQRGGLQPPEGIDAPVVNALIIGAIQQIVLNSAVSGRFAGLPVVSEADWQRLRDGIGVMIERIYGA